MLTIISQSGLSAEKAGKRMGLSGMTVRRWKSVPPNKKVPEFYASVFRDLIYRLVAEGRLDMSSDLILPALISAPPPRMKAVISHLGIDAKLLESKDYDQGRLIEALSQIGSGKNRTAEVDRNKSKIMDFRRMGAEWVSRIDSLWKVITSKELQSFEKLVAYGAIFYLLTPFDLISDLMPVFGYMDDFFFLGLAVAYYVKKHPELFQSEKARLGIP